MTTRHDFCLFYVFYGRRVHDSTADRLHQKPAREVLVGWMAYLAIALILAYTLGGALIL